MDVVTLALAKQYADAQRIAHEEWVTGAIGVGYEEGADFPVDSPIGMKIIDRKLGRRLLTTPTKRPESSFLVGFGKNQVRGHCQYNNFNGVLDEDCLIVTLMNSFLIANSDKYNGFIYVYEETHDNMGLGVTFAPGWYAVHAQTFAFEPMDLEKHPTMVMSEEIPENAPDYIYEIFQLREEISYTVTEENIAFFDSYHAICYGKTNNISSESITSLEGLGWLILTMSFAFTGNSITLSHTFSKTVLFSYPVVHQIDPKYIPPVDALMFNANGKTYRVAVDETGTLTTTEVG